MKNRNSRIKGQVKPQQSSEMIDEDDQNYQFSASVEYPFQEPPLKLDYENPVVQKYMLEKIKKKMKTIKYSERNTLESFLLTSIYEMFKSNQSIEISIIEGKLVEHQRIKTQGLEDIINKQKEGNYDLRIYDPFVLQNIFQHIMPINCYQLRDKSSRFTQIPNSIGIFLMGMPGAGKTSLIIGQLGNEMASIKFKEIPYLSLKGKLQKQHESLKTNRTGMPETQDLGIYDLKMPGTKKQKYYLIDTPGNFTEINNKLLILNAQKQCQRSLFFIIHELQLLKTLQGIFDLAKDIAQFFSFSTVQDLSSFLILILNPKGEKITQKDVLSSLLKFPIDSNKRSPKQQVAATFIFQSLKDEKNQFKNEISFFTSTNNRVALLEPTKKKKIQISQTIIEKIKYCGQQFQQNIFYYVDKAQIEKVVFYFDQLITLHTMFPEILQSKKNRVEKKLKTVSKNCINKFFNVLNSKIEERTITPKQLDMLEERRQFLQKFNELAAINKNISCQYDIKTKIGGLQNTLVALVHGLCKESQIHNIVNLINALNNQFGSYIPNLMNRIQGKCRQQIEDYHIRITQSKKTQNIGQFDKYFWQYKINYDFYCEFSKTKNSVFLQLNKFRDYRQILRQNKNEYTKVMEDLQAKLNKLIQCCQKNIKIDESLVHSLNNANSILMFSQQSEQIKANNVRQLFEKIQQEFQPISQSLIRKVFTVLEFKQNFEQQIASLDTLKQNLQIISKQILINSISAVPNISYDRICRYIEGNRAQFRKTLQNLIQQTNRKELFSKQKIKEYQILDKMKKKIEIYDMFTKEKQNQLLSFYESLKSAVDSNIRSILNAQFSDEMSGNVIQQVYATYENLGLYNRFGDQISDKIQTMNVKFEIKLKQFYKIFRVNSIQIKQIRNSTQFKRFKRFKEKIKLYLEYLLPNDIKNGKIIRCFDEHTSIYISARQIIIKLTTLINNVSREDIISRKQGENSQDLNPIVTFDEHERVKILKQVYEQLNDIDERHIVFVYIKNQQPKLVDAEGASINVTKRDIVKIIQQKVHQIKESVQSMSISGEKGIISLSDTLKKQCRLWLTFWQEANHSYLLDQQATIMTALTEIDRKVAFFSSNLQTGINDLFDNEGIRNKFLLQKYYGDLKYSLENNVEDLSSQFKTLLDHLDSYLRKQINLLTTLKDSSINDLHPNLLSKIQDSIQLYQYLTRFISNQDISRYQIRFLNLLQNSFNRAAQRAQRLKQRGILVAISSQINLHKFENAKKDIENESKDNKFLLGSMYDISEDINKLKDQLAQELKKIQKVFEDPLNQDNIDMLIIVYNQASVANKRKLGKKILDAFKKLFHIYHTLPYGSASQALADLKFAYQMIPSQIKQSQSDIKQLSDKAEQRNSAFQRDQQENIKSSSTSLLVWKYNDYLKSGNVLQYQCCQQLGRRINPIVNQILTKNYPIEIITHTKSDLMSLKQTQNIQSTSELHQIFQMGEDRILIKVSNMRQENVKDIQKVLQREIIPTNFKLQDINIQTKNLSDIHKKLITVIPRGKFIVDKITQFLQKIKGQFEKLCPIHRLQELTKINNYDLNKFGDLLKICIEKAYIYKRLFTQQGEKNDRASEEMIDENNDFSQILEKVYTFQDNINRQTDSMIAKLTNLTFNQLSHSCYTSLQVRNFLDDCGKTINLLRIYEDSRKQIENVDYMRNELHTSNLITTLQQKLDEFIDISLRKIEDAVKIKTNQFPKDYRSFQILLQQLNEGYGLFLISGRDEDSMMKKILDNPIKFLGDIIQKHIDEFKSTIFIQTQALMNFFDNEKPEHQRLLEALHLDYTKELEIILQKKIRTQQAQIQRFNCGELSQDSIRQIDDNYKNNIKNAQEQYEKKKKLCIQTFNPSRQDQYIKNYTLTLLNFQKIRQGLNSQYDSQRQSCKEIIDQQLKKLKSKDMMNLICKSLQEYDFGGYSMSLKKEYDLFKFQLAIIFIEKTKFQDVKYATDGIKLLSGKQIKKQLYKQQCNNVQDKIKALKAMAKRVFSKKKCMIQQIVNHYKQSQERLQKIARILSAWSIYKSSDKENQQQTQYEANAHPVQILALVVLTQKLVGSTDPMKEMQSKLAEVGTGEGKSIVLATLACYFAKQDYQVDVACYSQYLSSRDFKDFAFLFEIFGVKEKITYGTFNDICQKIINVEEYKKLTQEWLVSESQSMLGSILSRPMRWFQGFTQKLRNLFSKTKRIFLCDQCDVFFQKEYFGEVFRPILRFCYPQCTNFIEYVWKKVKENPHVTAEQIIFSIEFKALVAKFPILTTVFKNQIQEMIEGARNPKNPKHQYIISNNTIKYMNNGSLSDKLHYKFETIFLYLKFRDQKRLQLIKQNIFIPINIAQFMYSYIPIYYSAIIGLSGTVQHLIKGGKQDIIKQLYSIQTDYIYILPSIYKQKDCTVSAPYLQNTLTYYQKIIELTEIQLIKERPVFICFQNHSKLIKLQNDPLFKEFINKNDIFLNFLHQYLDDKEQRDSNVKQAVKKGQITLIAQQYLRGTDFIVLDNQVKKKGGVHIILTYITESESLFIQCKGRTARMGESGSVDHVLNTDQLPKQFKLPDNVDISSMKTAMGQYWEQKDRKMIEEKKVKIERNKVSHNQTMKFVKGEDHKLENFIKFIQNLNYFPAAQNKTIVIGIDATFSMKAVFVSLIKNLKLVMNRKNQMMQQNNIKGKLKIMIAAYRNYNSGDKVLEVSKFYEHGEPLVNFLKTIDVEKGWGNEAIEVLFQYINDKLKKVDGLILIGDAPPNTPEHVKRKRNLQPSGTDRNNNKWPEFGRNNPTVYPQTTFERERNKFSKQCIISGLYLKNPDQTLIKDTEAFFNNINSQFGFKGNVKELNLSDLKEGQLLTKFLTTEIISVMNGGQNREKIQEMYRESYYV